MQNRESYASDAIEILSEPDANPFTCTHSDVEEAYHPMLELVDSDKEGDSDIEID